MYKWYVVLWNSRYDSASIANHWRTQAEAVRAQQAFEYTKGVCATVHYSKY